MSAPTLTPRQEEVLDASLRSRTLAGAARELGIGEEAVSRSLHRAGRRDVLHRLTGHTPAAAPPAVLCTCGVPVDAAWAARTGLTTHPACTPTPEEATEPAGDDPPAWTLTPADVEPVPYTGGDWRESALCAQTDPEAFFPEKGGSTREAKRVCLSCEVRVQCLDYALEADERFGIWGGLSERERRRVKKAAL